ncbi:siderophore-interacting protein [Micromonospora sp. 4G55]|uniref:siderophore-interacting protein n=1 Tax=Micromonospora sp. 4G55 TaxID=2806102 RepID=UPI001A3B95E3|nr:siderophore-interacting protein [Micromonospora sp. 4G55]MBM0258809.1 siderophore-interacting protein [Micromonospora sp. 4G55]
MTTGTATPVALRYRFYQAQVRHTRRIGASLIRVTLTGEELAAFAGGGRDQSVSLFLPHPGQPEPVVPLDAGDDWYARWRATDPAIRAVMRSYTISGQRPETAEVDVDFVHHGDSGPATRWAGRARPGDRIVLLGPAERDNRSVCFRPPARHRPRPAGR